MVKGALKELFLNLFLIIEDKEASFYSYLGLFEG